MSFLYLIATNHAGVFTGPVKIGVTRSLVSRLRSIQTCSPYRLSLYEWWDVGDADVAVLLERDAHAIMAPERLHGEWFNAEPEHARFWIEAHLWFVLSEITGRSYDNFSGTGVRRRRGDLCRPLEITFS